MYGERNILILVGSFIISGITIIGCTSAQDIYQNPYTTGSERTGATIYHQASASEVSSKQPGWIYAVSKEFYVGYGQGNSVMEAKYAALSDIKAFITKSLGETGKVKEVTIVENTITGPNRASGREDYLLKYDFENEYQPVIQISFDRFGDYYYEFADYKARYYIKYNINDAELHRIKEEFQKSLEREEERKILREKEIQESLRKEKARKIEIKRSIDSLISFQGLLSIESLIDRYHGITDFIYENDMESTDSLLLINGLRNLKGFLSAVEIEMLNHHRGESLRFGLFGGNTLLLSKIQPIVQANGVKVKQLKLEDGIWNLTYLLDEEGAAKQNIKIVFELPYDRIETTVDITPIALQPEFQVLNNILFSNLELNNWTGKLTAFKVGINIHSNSSEVHQLSGLDLVLYVDGASNPVIHINPVNQEIPPGTSRVVRKVDCQLPSRFFMRNEMTCALKLSMSKNGSTHTYDLYDVPITINH